MTQQSVGRQQSLLVLAGLYDHLVNAASPLAQRGVQVLHLTVQSATLHDPEPVDTVLHPHGLEADGEGGEEEQAGEQDLARVDLNAKINIYIYI